MPDESKEEAQERRAKQAEKRRLAAQKAKEEMARRATRKRGAPNSGDADRKFEVGTKKRARMIVQARKKIGSATKMVAPRNEHREEDDEMDDEKVENEGQEGEGEEEIDDEMASGVQEADEEDSATSGGNSPAKKMEEERRKPTARAVATACSRETKNLPARKSQTVKHEPSKILKSAAAIVQTPTRPRSSSKSQKPPFGSPMPPKFTSRPKAPTLSNVDLPTTNQNKTLSSATVVSKPSVTPLDPPVAATTRSYNSTGSDSSNPVVSDPTSNIAMPKMRDLSELYAELERLDQEEEDDDYDSDDDSDGSEDDDDQELRLQALQVIAERQDRERIQQMQQQAAEASRLQEEQDDLARKRRARYKWPILTLLTVTFLYWKYPEECRELLFGPKPVLNIHTCFLDSQVNHQNATTVEEDPICANPDEVVESFDPPLTVEWAPCPMGSVCRGGRLIDCPSLHSIHDKSCYLSLESNETIAAVQQLIHEWTVSSYCSMDVSNLEDASNANNWTGRPFFRFVRVMEKLGLNETPFHDLQFLQWGNVSSENMSRFVVEGDWVALHPGVPLKIPMTCKVSGFVFGVFSLSWTILGIVAAFLWGVTKQLLWVYYRALVASPAYFGLASLFSAGLSASLYRRYLARLNRQERNLAIVQARLKVYESLREQSGVELSSAWLGQDLAWKLYEMSSRGRRRFVQHTWPCVVRDIAEDSRVAKTVRTEQGKRVEYWKWVAPTASSSGTLNENGSHHRRVVRFDE